MKRSTLINLHLYFSGTITFILSLYVFSGSLHLLGFDESEDRKEISIIQLSTDVDKKELEKIFENYLKTSHADYSYEYLKAKGNVFITRPTTKSYYAMIIDKENGIAKIELVIPSFRKKLLEFHMGHGPSISRTIMGSIGLIMLLSVVTGVWLGLTVKKYLPITIAASLTGLVLVIFLFLI